MTSVPAPGDAEQAVLAERERIARELHDTVIQRLFAVGMRLQVAVGKDADALAGVVQQALGDLDAVIHEIRSTIFALQSAGGAGVRAALVEVVADAAPALGFEPRIRFDGPVDALVPDRVKDDAVVVLREALRVTVGRGGARRAEVDVSAGDEFTLVVMDDAEGEVADADAYGPARERADALGGSLDVGAAPDGGAVVEWRVPLGRGS